MYSFSHLLISHLFFLFSIILHTCRDEQYHWIQNALALRKVNIYSFGKMNFIHTVLSKRKLNWFVENKLVEGEKLKINKKFSSFFSIFILEFCCIFTYTCTHKHTFMHTHIHLQYRWFIILILLCSFRFFILFFRLVRSKISNHSGAEYI
jgi:tRNA synthetases class I (E and Q), catalytic domain